MPHSHDHSATHEAHRHAGPRTVSFAVLTISDTRTPETDESGKTARGLIEKAGYTVARLDIVPDEAKRIGAWLLQAAKDRHVEAILTNGGTGISARDTTYEVIEKKIERPLPGFGELFRALSHGEIGSAAMLSRAAAGIFKGKPLFAVPGSPAAVTLALERLILPEISHLIGELRKHGHEHKKHKA
ncbi:MAG: MogA/MoaB family molybdenum cofactor biosynthesis protein [Bdellovibrionota bacterium]